LDIKPIATIQTEFPEKFGIPRQSGLASTYGKIVFEEKFRRIEAVRGLEHYSHLWLIWQFSKNLRNNWSPTVRPPRLGGNTRLGVFATRSPFRPNALGLSSVKIVSIDLESSLAPIIYIEGPDLLNGTPIFDIKPYLSYTDSHPDAKCGFADEKLSYMLNVEITDEVIKEIPQDKLNPLKEILKSDPRPAYQNDPQRVYKMSCLGLDIEFSVISNTLKVIRVMK